MLLISPSRCRCSSPVFRDGHGFLSVCPRIRQETINDDVSLLQEDLQREEMPPLGHGRMERGYESLPAPEGGKDVVLYIQLPIEIGDKGLHFVKITSHHEKEIQHMDPLVHHNSATSQLPF